MKHFKLSPEDNYMHTTSPLQETEGRFRYTPQERAASSVRKAFATDRTFVITEVQHVQLIMACPKDIFVPLIV